MEHDFLKQKELQYVLFIQASSSMDVNADNQTALPQIEISK